MKQKVGRAKTGSKTKRNPKMEPGMYPPGYDPGKIVTLHPCMKEFVGFCMMKIGMRIRMLADDELSQFGLVAPQFGILMILRESGPMTQVELGNYLSIDKATIVRMLDQLEGKKLLTRTTSAQDRRAKLLQVTAAGLKAVDKMDVIRRKAEDEILGTLTDSEREQLKKLVTKLVQSPKIYSPK